MVFFLQETDPLYEPDATVEQLASKLVDIDCPFRPSAANSLTDVR
jgi:hypothetical protein